MLTNLHPQKTLELRLDEHYVRYQHEACNEVITGNLVMACTEATL
jgi:hypothetical protein